MKIESGYEEITHTADVSLRVWAPTLEQLFQRAAEGMYDLMKLEILDMNSKLVIRKFHLEAIDDESLLVLFLSEILFIIEEKSLGFVKLDLQKTGPNLDVVMEGKTISSRYSDIKAVTFHELKIKQVLDEYSVIIVFDT